MAATSHLSDGPNPYQSRILVALSIKGHDRLQQPGGIAQGKVYEGTVPAKEKARRRAANKVAKASRKANR